MHCILDGLGTRTTQRCSWEWGVVVGGAPLLSVLLEHSPLRFWSTTVHF